MTDKLKNISDLILAGYNIEFLGGHTKRMALKEGGIRGYHYRYVWKLSTNKHHTIESQWSGFSTPEECISDMLQKVARIESAKLSEKAELS